MNCEAFIYLVTCVHSVPCSHPSYLPSYHPLPRSSPPFLHCNRSTSTAATQPSMVQPSAQTKERGSQHQRESKSRHHHHTHHSKQHQQGHKQQQLTGPAPSPPPSHDDLWLHQGAKVESSTQQPNNDRNNQNQIVPAASPGECGSMLGVEPSFTGDLEVSTTRHQVDLHGSRAGTGSITSTPSVSPSGSLTTSSSSSSVIGEKQEEGHVGVPKVAMVTGNTFQSGGSLPCVSRPQTQLEGSGSSPVNGECGEGGRHCGEEEQSKI